MKQFNNGAIFKIAHVFRQINLGYKKCDIGPAEYGKNLKYFNKGDRY